LSEFKKVELETMCRSFAATYTLPLAVGQASPSAVGPHGVFGRKPDATVA